MSDVRGVGGGDRMPEKEPAATIAEPGAGAGQLQAIGAVSAVLAVAACLAPLCPVRTSRSTWPSSWAQYLICWYRPPLLLER